MIRHDAFLELAAASLDFELSNGERTRLETHLAGCDACRHAASAFRADARAIATVPVTPLGSRHADALLAGIITPRRDPVAPLRLLAVAALIGLLAIGSIVVGAELLRRAQQDTPVVVVPSPPASPGPDASPVAPGWAAVAVPAREASGRWDIRVKGVAIGADGMVAFGGFHCRDDETDCRLGMLWSADGGSWQVVPAQDALWTEMYVPTSGPELGIIDVVQGPAGWVAVGRVADPVSEGQPLDVHVATWTSNDGRTWTRSTEDAPFERIDPQAIAADGANYVIVGTDISASADLATGTAWAAALVSSDGRTWTRTDLGQQLVTGGFCDTGEWPVYGGMQAVAAVDGGGFLAVGAVETGDLAPDVTCAFTSAAWTSPDGLAWQRIATFPEIDGGSSDVATDGTRVAAVSGTAVATSVDGREWEMRPTPDGLTDPDVAIDGADMVLADPTGIGPTGSTLWRSSPGGDWVEEALPGVPLGPVRIVAVEVRGPIAAIVGWGEPFDEGEPPSYSLVRRRARSPAPTGAPTSDPPTADTWVDAGRTGASHGRAAVLPVGDDGVLVVGDDNVCSPGFAWGSSETTELRDATGAWSTVGSLPTPRDRFGAANLRDGRVLIAGGLNATGQSFSSAYVFDPAGRSWSRTGLLIAARTDPAIALLADGRVLVAGGSYYDQPSGATARVLASAELYDPGSGAWTTTGSLAQARTGARAVTLDDGRVLIVGGTTDAAAYPFNGSPLASAELYDPATGEWSGAGALVEARAGFALVALPDGGALLAGGLAFRDAGEFGVEQIPVSSVDRFDAGSARWLPAADMAEAAFDRAAVRLSDGRVLVAGGDTSAQEADLDSTPDAFTAAVDVYDPTSDTWTQLAPLPAPRADAKAVLLDDGTVLVVTGYSAPAAEGSTPACPIYGLSAWRYLPG